MQYRRIPFYKSGMRGLGNAIPRKLPFTNGFGNYGAEFPNSSFLGASDMNVYQPKVPYGPTFASATPWLAGLRGLGADAPVQTTIMLRPKAGAPSGWPGFFGWLAANHPDVYNYAKVALPQRLVSATEGHRTGGATLAGLGFLGDNTGDDTSDPGLVTFDAGPVFITPQTATVADSGETSAAPVFTAAGTSQIVNTLTQAAATLIPAINQQQIFQAQLNRAAAGLPPLNTSAYGLTSGAVASGFSASIGGLLPFALIGGAVLVLMSLGKKG
jgi:hypothetical protein